MKICVTAVAGSLDAQVDPRFGRCAYFVIVDPDTMSFKAIPNTNVDALSGAGIQSAQMVVNEGVDVVITGQVGPNAYQVLSSAGVKIITGAFGTVREVVEAYKSGRLRETPFSPGFGMGRGMGMGMGMGRGRGMGRRMGIGGFGPTLSPQIPSQPTPPAQLTREQEILMLEEQLKFLQEQLKQVKKRLEELRSE